MSATTPTRRVWLRNLSAALIVLSLLAVGFMLTWWGAAGIGGIVWRALPALPESLTIHALQLALSGIAWRCLMLPAPRALIVLRARWVRESLNTALPLAGIGGAVGSTRMLARGSGIGIARAAASLTADLTIEAAAQAPFLILSLAAVAIVVPGQFSVARAAWAIIPIALGTAGFILAQRAGVMRLVEKAARRLGFGEAMAGLHDGVMALHARRLAILQAFLLHFLSWSLGGAEVWVILHAVGVPVGAGAAFAIEGLGMAARSLGFALPAGLAAQEAGFVLACSVFGISPQDGLALSMVKRLREVVVAVAGILVWRRQSAAR